MSFTPSWPAMAGGFTVELERRPARREIRDLEILPADTSLPAGAMAFMPAPWRRSGPRNARTVGFALDISDFARRVDAVDETAPVPADGCADAVNFGKIHSHTDDHFSSLRRW